MKHIYYLQEGISVEALPEGYDKFYIVENRDIDSVSSRYWYMGDEIQYELEALCVDLYDVFQDAVFPDREEYYKNYDIQPRWISRAGMDSDLDISQCELIECFSRPIYEHIAKSGFTNDTLMQAYQEIDDKKFKYAYVADCQALINTLQELIVGCDGSFIGFYKQLCTLHADIGEKEGAFYGCGANCQMVYSFLYSFIIQCHSIFDILTKIAYEMENIKIDLDSYAKLASCKTTYKEKKRLKMNTKGTVFEKCRTTAIIENLRNELVHNATWEMNSKIFINLAGSSITTRYIFLPDFKEDGTLVAFKNRKRFFSSGKTVNEELPPLYFDVLQRIHATLIKMNTYV